MYIDQLIQFSFTFPANSFRVTFDREWIWGPNYYLYDQIITMCNRITAGY